MNDSTFGPGLRRSLNLVTLSGCFCMIFLVGISSPLQTEFFRALGAREIHFGIIGGVPLVMMFMNFVGAVLVNRVFQRKKFFIVVSLCSRLLLLPIAFLPMLFPSWGPGILVTMIVILLSVSNLLANLSPPFWFSWMADLIPARILNRYWGYRQFFLQMAWVVGFLATGLFIYLDLLPVRLSYPLLATIGVAFGVVDLWLFIWVDEPPNQMLPEAPIWEVLLAPLRHPQYRPYLFFFCVWSFCVMFAASFIQLYILKILQVALWQATLLWCLGGLANGFMARVWGRVADRHGYKPVMIICGACKPLVMLALGLVTPVTAMPVLSVAILLDGLWNAGNDIAGNGYMLKIAPRENRSMFIAAIIGLAGFCGGVGALSGGVFLECLDGFHLELAGRVWSNYHLLFFGSILLRFSALTLLVGVKEPASSSPIRVLSELKGLGPMRALAFPIGLYRRLNPDALLTKRK